MRKGGLLSLDEWDRQANLDLVLEPPTTKMGNRVGVECPADNRITRGQCKASLWDLPFYVGEIREKRRAVYCFVCGWLGSRAIGATGPNGDSLRIVKNE